MPFAAGPVLGYSGRGIYRTIGPTDYAGKDQIIHIPSDFPTDLASVPRIFWAALPPSGVYEQAAVLHDFLCIDLAQAKRHDRLPMIPSVDVDGLFRRVAREGGAGFLTRWALWTGVRYGALLNPARRPGWWRDAPKVTAISLVGLVVTCTAIYGLDYVVHYLIGLL